MDGIQMEPIGKYKADRNGSAKATAWRNMVDQDLDDVAFLGDSEKAREAHDRSAPVAVCSQRRAICLVVLVFSTMFGTALIIVYAIPQPDCPCAPEEMLVPGSVAPGSDASSAAANKERIATNGATFPWRGARLPPYVVPKHYSLWLHPNLTTGELRGEVSIDFKVDRDTMFVVLNVRDMNVTERALFKSGGILGPKIVKTLEYPPAEQTYIEFKDKLRRKYNYTLSLRFITKLDRSDKQRGFFLAGSHRHRCAVSRFWLTHARSAFPCFDEPHFRAPFKFTIVRDRFHVSLTNMPIVATEEAGFYLGHRLLQDEFVESPPMAPHMISVTVCRLQRRAAPPLPTESTPTTPEPTLKPPTSITHVASKTTGSSIESTSEGYVEDIELPPPELSLYSDQQVILDDSAPFLEWVQKTIQQFAFELNTSYPLPKLDIVVLEGGSQYSEGWGLISLAPSTLSDTKTIARLLAQQWFGGLVSPRWWTSQWLMEALTSVIGQKAPPFEEIGAEKPEDTLLLEHVLPALRLDASNSVRAVASPRLERADIEAATDELSLHKGAAIVSMAIEAAGESRGRIALSSLLRDHRSASADARDLWLALNAPGTWDQWSERPGYPLVTASVHRPNVHLHQQRFLMTADPPSEEEPAMLNNLLTLELRADLDEIFYEPDNFTEPIDEDVNATTTTPMPTTTKRAARTTKPPPMPKWVIPITFIVGPLDPELEDKAENSSSGPDKHATDHGNNWYDIGNETKINGSRWAENVTHLVWMNDTDMVIPDLGRHKWVRYNVGARGLYRVAPQDPAVGESLESAAQRSSAQYTGGAPAERALILDDAFVLSRAGTLPASRALAAAARLSSERHWAPWRVVLSHMSLWRQLLRLTAAGPPLMDYLKTLHPIVTLYQHKDIASGVLNEDQLWLSGALLSAGVEWENPVVTRQAVDLFDTWFKNNHTIADLYQQAAFTAGIRTYGRPAWAATWKALMSSYAAPKPLYNHKSLLYALASAKEDWLFYRFARTSLTNVPPRERRMWLSAVWSGACSWRGTSAVGALLADAGIVGGALPSAAACLYESRYYYQIKSMFPEARGLQSALDTIALNAAWVAKAEPDLVRYFNTMQSKN